jgi:sugar/nucleoside kinase (ribokinase family)
MSVLIVGSIALDTVETPFGKRDDALGGAATYFSCAASYFGQPRIVGVVGEDFPSEHVELLRSRGVDLDGLEVQKGNTFRWSGKYGFDLNQRDTLSTELNVFEHFHPKLPESYRSSEFVFLGNIHPGLQLEVLQQVESPTFVACDTMNMWIEIERDTLCELISKVDAILINDSEARELADDPNLSKAARIIQNMGCRQVIIKKGEHGCLFFAPQSHFSAPAYPLEAVNDPTGAGDAFAGGFMGYLSQIENIDDTSLRRAIIYGSVMASFTVEEFSVDRIVGLSKQEIDARYQEFREITTFD